MACPQSPESQLVQVRIGGNGVPGDAAREKIAANQKSNEREEKWRIKKNVANAANAENSKNSTRLEYWNIAGPEKQT